MRVNRNLNAPIFDPVSYPKRIAETTRMGTVIVKVTATDRDIHVS